MPFIIAKLKIPYAVFQLPPDTPKERAIEVFKQTPGMGSLFKSVEEANEAGNNLGFAVTFEVEE